MSDPIVTAAKTEATQLATEAKGAAQGWLRRNVWGLLALAATALVVAALALRFG